MLSNLRSFAKSPWALVIIVLIIVAFASTGVGGIFTGSGTAVVVVGSEQISQRELAQAYEFELRRIQRENPDFTAQQAREAGLPDQVLQRLIAEAAFTAKATELGLAVSPDAVVREVASYEAFRNPVTGQFDADTMREVLRSNGTTEQIFEAQVKSDLMLRQLTSALTAGNDLPPQLAATRFNVAGERRRLTGLVLDPDSLDSIEAPSDEVLREYIAANPDVTGPIGLPVFTAPEFRGISLVRFRLEDFVRNVDIDESLLRETYEYQVDAGIIGTAPRRSFVQLTAPDADTAELAASRLNEGVTPSDTAAELGLVEPLTLEEVQAYEVPDTLIADAVFAMREGEARAVEGRFGWSIVQVTMAEDGVTPTFEEQRETLLTEAARAQALDNLYDRVSAFESARADGMTLEDAARETGSPLEIFAPMDRYARYEDLEIDMERFTALGPDILATAFEQPQGFAIDLQQYNETDYFTVRVDSITEERLRELDEVRDEAEARWRMIQVDTAMQARAEEARAALVAGDDLDIAALSFGGRGESVTLSRGETAGGFGRDVVARAFASDLGEWVVVPNRATGQYVILTVEDIIPGGAEGAELGELAAIDNTLSQEFADDVLLSVQNALLEEYGIDESAIDRRLFNNAIGLSDSPQ
ncbi:peptidylprolyl isomerase [Maricaulis sp. CAU 1757]